jgi:hypothetical protein
MGLEFHPTIEIRLSINEETVMAEANLERATEAQIAAEAGEKRDMIESVLGEPEPWESWETQLCLWSFGIGISTLLVLGFLVNKFLLP